MACVRSDPYRDCHALAQRQQSRLELGVFADGPEVVGDAAAHLVGVDVFAGKQRAHVVEVERARLDGVVRGDDTPTGTFSRTASLNASA